MFLLQKYACEAQHGEATTTEAGEASPTAEAADLRRGLTLIWSSICEMIETYQNWVGTPDTLGESLTVT